MMDQGFINIDKIVDQLDITSNMAIADFGSGQGFFAITFAKKIGPSGQVFAIDIIPSALEATRSRTKLEGLFNIKLIRGNLEKPNGSTLPSESCDMAFIANVLFQVSDKSILIGEARRILKTGGHLAIIEWRPLIALGPQQEFRLLPEELEKLVLSWGFSKVKTINAGSHHYGFVFQKQ